MNQFSKSASAATVEPAPAEPTLGLAPESARVAVVSAAWHADIVARTREALLAELARQGLPVSSVECFEVPGAFEIPLLAARLARTQRFHAIAACALVVDGGIYRHEFVAAAVIDGLMRVQLDSGVPVFSAVLTPHQFHEHETHARFFGEHMVLKGQELARACMATLAVHGALAETAD
jgi:6,7-dimethyl-8-ribityllumazine synthase